VRIFQELAECLEDKPEAKELFFTRDGLAIDDAGPWAEAQPRSPVCRGFVRFATRSGVSPRLKQFQTLLLLIVVLIRQKKAPAACAGASKEVSRAPRDQGALDAPIVSQGTNHARRGLAMRIDGSTESAHRTFPTLRQRGRVFSLRCLYLSPGRPVGASCSRRRPPRRLQVFGPVRERRRAARLCGCSLPSTQRAAIGTSAFAHIGGFAAEQEGAGQAIRLAKMVAAPTTADASKRKPRACRSF
jgi:hypothetical protein